MNVIELISANLFIIIIICMKCPNKYASLQNIEIFLSLFGSQKRLICKFFVKYLPGVLKKKTKVVDIFYTDKKCFMKFNLKHNLFI